MNDHLSRPMALAFLGDPNSVHTRRWITFFAERGHRIHVLVPGDQPLDPGLDERIHVERFVAYPRMPVRGLGGLATRRSLRRALGRVSPQILHAHSLTRYGWMAHACGFRPLVISVWGSDVLRAEQTSWWTRLRSGRALAAAALVTAVSRPLADRAIRLGAHPDRVRIVQFGVDPERFSPGPVPEDLRRSIGVEGKRVVLAPRAIRPLYRQTVVVRALAQLPDDVVVVFSEGGQDPAERARIEAQAAVLGVAGRLRFVPPIPHDEMPAHYRMADVVVSVPESDAFPVTALEAMACGIPIVMSNLPSALEGLGAVDPGALVPVGDADATAAAILARLGLPADERGALAARLRDAAIARGDTRTNLQAMEAEYRRLVGAG